MDALVAPGSRFGRPRIGAMPADESRCRTPLSSRPDSQAFTLVELLVVIAIVSLLAGLLLPALEASIKQARRTACRSNHRQHFLAAATYADEFEGFLPLNNRWQNGGRHYRYQGYSQPENDAGINGGNLDLATYRWWGVGLFAYLRYLEPDTVFLCPETSGSLTSGYEIYRYGELNLSIMKNAVGADLSYNQRLLGPYILNSLPYYEADSTNLAQGRLGRPGMRGAIMDPDLSAYGPLEHVTSLIQCLCGCQDPPAGGSCHDQDGTNTTFFDGHTRWLELTARDAAMLRQFTGVNSYGNVYINAHRGFWPWATWKDGS